MTDCTIGKCHSIIVKNINEFLLQCGRDYRIILTKLLFKACYCTPCAMFALQPEAGCMRAIGKVEIYQKHPLLDEFA